MFGSSWRVGRIAGVEIRVDTSWLIIAVLITYNLFVEFTASFPEVSAAVGILLAVGVAALFFGSVLGHEMAHALTAMRRGIPVRGITLFLFGGATHAKVESRRARDEFLISVVGPLSSLLFAGLFFAVVRLGRDVLPEPVRAGLGYLTVVNVVLAIFNLLPGFPLDGGRVLRSIIWHTTGSFARATRFASVSGQVLGYLLVAGGLAVVVFRGIQGLWFAAIGWFLAQAARGSARDLEVRRALEDVDAEDVMPAGLVSIPSELTLREAAERYFTTSGHSVFPVKEGERTVGVLSRRAVNEISPDDWGHRTVREAMTPLDDQLTVAADTPMNAILTKLEDEEARRVLVVRDGDVVGIITPTDVATWLQRWRTLRAAADET